MKSLWATSLDGRERIPAININTAKDRYAKHVERKTKDVRGFNSYVAPGPFHQYQVDVWSITDKQLPNQKYKLFLILIAVFSKNLTVIGDNYLNLYGNNIMVNATENIGINSGTSVNINTT